MARYLPLILIGVLLNAAAQLLLKKGMLAVGQFAFKPGDMWQMAPRIALDPYIIAGLTIYVVSVVAWMLVLSRVDVSAAYPFLSIGYVFAAVGGWVFFAETISLERMLGMALICVGVVFVARS